MMRKKNVFPVVGLVALVCGCATQQPPPNTTVQKIPLLGDIPLLGILFRHETVSATDSSRRLSGAESTPQTVLQKKDISLPSVTWPPENIAVADLAPYTLSQGETKTLTEKLHTTLVQTEYFNVLSRSDMRVVLQEQQFQRTDNCDDSACLVEMGKLLTVQKIVGGSVGKVGSTFSLSVRLVNVETGKTELMIDKQLKAEPDELLSLVEQAGRELALKYAESRKGR